MNIADSQRLQCFESVSRKIFKRVVNIVFTDFVHLHRQSLKRKVFLQSILGDCKKTLKTKVGQTQGMPPRERRPRRERRRGYSSGRRRRRRGRSHRRSERTRSRGRNAPISRMLPVWGCSNREARKSLSLLRLLHSLLGDGEPSSKDRKPPAPLLQEMSQKQYINMLLQVYLETQTYIFKLLILRLLRRLLPLRSPMDKYSMLESRSIATQCKYPIVTLFFQNIGEALCPLGISTPGIEHIHGLCTNSRSSYSVAAEEIYLIRYLWSFSRNSSWSHAVRDTLEQCVTDGVPGFLRAMRENESRAYNGEHSKRVFRSSTSFLAHDADSDCGAPKAALLMAAFSILGGFRDFFRMGSKVQIERSRRVEPITATILHFCRATGEMFVAPEANPEASGDLPSSFMYDLGRVHRVGANSTVHVLDGVKVPYDDFELSEKMLSHCAAASKD